MRECNPNNFVIWIMNKIHLLIFICCLMNVQKNLNKIPDDYIEVVISDAESRDLANLYLDEKAVSSKYYEDALHIAIATINRVNVLASWNFKHIVNLERIRLYNAVNLKNGYSNLEIRTPGEILKFDDYE